MDLHFRSPSSACRLGLALLLSFAAACSQADVTPTDDVAESKLAARIAALEANEDIRATLLRFAMIVDSGDPAKLATLSDKIHADLRVRVVDFVGQEREFEGLEGLVEKFGPIMASAQANLAPSAIWVNVQGDSAEASFKFINAVQPPPELGLDIDETVLLFAANTASFMREDGVWKLASLELIHSLAYPEMIEDEDEGD